MLIKNGIAISMHGKGAWRDNIFVERLWRSIKYEEVYLRGYDSVSDLALRSANTSRFTTVGGPTRALTAKHPIKLTSPRCYSAWQPNRGRRSTYRRGKTVQTTETTSDQDGAGSTDFGLVAHTASTHAIHKNRK